jgi:hypothetical protein
LIYDCDAIENITKLTSLEHIGSDIANRTTGNLNASLSLKSLPDRLILFEQMFPIIRGKAIAKTLAIAGWSTAFQINKTKTLSLLFHI